MGAVAINLVVEQLDTGRDDQRVVAELLHRTVDGGDDFLSGLEEASGDEFEQLGIDPKEYAKTYLEGFDYKNRNIRIKFLGDRTALDPKLQKMMNELEGDSACKTGMTLNIAINYGGRPEIVRAAQQLAAKAAAGEIRPEDINEQMMSDAMYTAGQKDPDFILRPSGEKRLSNFMLWQAAYSELVEMDVLWPDFTRADLDTAIEEFNHRSRRFGGI